MSQQVREGARPSGVTPRVVGATVVTLAGGTLFAGGQPVQAATFTVTNTNDSGPGSLRQAVLYANAASGADTITITATGTIDISTRFDLADDVTIVGPGSGLLTIDTNNSENQIFYNNVAAGLDVSLSGMTLREAANYAIDILPADSVVLDDLVVTANGGGGVLVYADTLTVTDSTFSGNGSNGLFAYTSVSASLSNVTASENASYGVYLTGYGSSTHTVTSSVMEGNGSSGLFIYVPSSYTITGVTNVVLSDVTTSNNTGYGTVISGYYQDISIDGLTSTYNGSTGLMIYYAGDLSVANSIVSDNGGSGIRLEYQYGDVTLTDVTAERNYQYGASLASYVSIEVDGLTASQNRYAGLFVPYAGSLIVENSTFSTNGAGMDIEDVTYDTTIRDVEVSDSYSEGIRLLNLSSRSCCPTETLLERVTVVDSATAGIFSERVTATLVNSTITGSGGSGIESNGRNVDQGDGSDWTVLHSTITGNALSGLYSDGGGDEIDAAHTWIVDHSIVSGNEVADIVNVSEGNPTPGSTTVTHSLVDAGSAHAGGSNVEADDPLLEALADNGGSTRTMRPASGSPAISAGDAASAVALPTTDQRGLVRVQGVIEIGAVEINPGVIGIQAPTEVAADDPGITLTLTRTDGADGAVSVTLRSCDGTEETVSWDDLDVADKTVTFPIPAEYAGQECTIEVVGSTGGVDVGEVASFPVTVVAGPTTTVPVTTVPTTTIPVVTPTTTPVTPEPTLPPTGGGDRSGPVVWLAGALVAVGSVFARVTRRRHA